MKGGKATVPPGSQPGGFVKMTGRAKELKTTVPAVKRRNAGLPELVEKLRERISVYEIAPGSKLKEQELSDEFGVSRARIREALGALVHDGLVNRLPNRGAVVTRLDVKTVRQLFDVREVMEGLCARLATINSDPESWQGLLDLFGEPMQKAVENGDLEFYIKNYELFRRRLIDAAENEFVGGMLQLLHNRTKVLMRRIVIMSDRAKHGVAEHRAVLVAMRRGDADEAERLRRTTIANARACFERFHPFIL
jgi:DNA-binding GntR family transcriptional regulator